MKIKLLAIGDKMPAWVNDAVDEYTKRLPRDFLFEIIGLPMSKRSKTKSVANYQHEEAATLKQAAAKATKVIALDVKGKSLSTELLVANIQQWQLQGDDVCILVGGPDGIDASLLAGVDARWSLSGLTLPHPVVRLVFAEQIYRAWSIIQGHPYHR